MKYLDVEVVISPARGGDFEVNVASDAGGEGNSKLKLPFAMSALSGVMYNLRGANRAFVTGEETPDAPIGTASSFGVQLFEALFQGETREVLSRTESEAKRQPDTGVRIRLSMNLAAEGMAEVASLPWELMRRRDQSPLVVSVQTPVVRAFDTPKPIFLQPLAGKLRILALVSNPKGTAALNLDEEVKRISKIWATLDNVVVDFVRPVEEEVLNHLAENQYHVIHYMGHGDFDSGAGGLLMMERDDGSAQLVSGDTFAAWLQDEPLRLVFLNACNTGTTGEHMGLHPFAGVASALIRSGVPAVVAMQFPISDKAAIIFAQTFYERIAQSFPVDAAVSDGRKRLLTGEGAEWATPVLYMRAVDGNLFDQAKPGITPRKRVAAKAASTGDDAASRSPPAGLPPADATPPQPLFSPVDSAPPALTPWHRKPLVLSGIGVGAVALVAVLVAWGGDKPVEPPVVTPVDPPATVAVMGNQAAEAIAALPPGTWISDPDESNTISKVLATATLPMLKALADAGDAKAAYLTGGALWYGLGGANASPARAIPYYRKAADGGLVVGLYALGYALAAGVAAEPDGAGGTIAGVPADDAKARPLLRKAAMLGNTSAWQALVDSYQEILVIPDDPSRYPPSRATEAIAAIEPRRWHDDQAAYVDPPAVVAQSVLQLAPVADIKALAAAGNAKANYVMGRAHIEGWAGQPQNQALAVPFMLVAARGGVAEAMYALGWMTEQGVPAADNTHPGITRDAAMSKTWFRKSAELGNPSAQSMGLGPAT